MNKKLYGIFHWYDVDGGFGDAVGQEDLLFISESEEIANAYAEKWSNGHVYDKPYDELCCGDLVVRELPSTFITENSLSIPPWDLVPDYCAAMMYSASARDLFEPIDDSGNDGKEKTDE